MALRRPAHLGVHPPGPAAAGGREAAFRERRRRGSRRRRDGLRGRAEPVGGGRRAAGRPVRGRRPARRAVADVHAGAPRWGTPRPAGHRRPRSVPAAHDPLRGRGRGAAVHPAGPGSSAARARSARPALLRIRGARAETARAPGAGRTHGTPVTLRSGSARDPIVATRSHPAVARCMGARRADGISRLEANRGRVRIDAAGRGRPPNRRDQRSGDSSCRYRTSDC